MTKSGVEHLAQHPGWKTKRQKPKARLYTVKKDNNRGCWWVITPSGKTVAAPHETRRTAVIAAAVFNDKQRNENDVATLEEFSERTTNDEN